MNETFFGVIPTPPPLNRSTSKKWNEKCVSDTVTLNLLSGNSHRKTADTRNVCICKILQPF